MSATENFVSTIAPATLPPQPAEVPPSVPPPSEVETPPIPVEMPTDSPVEPMVLEGAPPGISVACINSTPAANACQNQRRGRLGVFGRCERQHGDMHGCASRQNPTFY